MALYRDFAHSSFVEILICLTIILLSCIALYVSPEEAANLPAVPDEGQYAISASNLFSKGTYTVTFNHSDYPGYYPHGFSLLLLPALYLWGPFVGNVAYMNFLLNVGVVILSYILGRMIGGWVVGSVAASFLLGNHLFLHFSHRIFAQGAVAFFTILAIILLIKIQDRQDESLPLGLLGALGVVAGYLSAVHASWICFDVAVVVCLCLIYYTHWQKLSGALLIVIGLASIFIVIQLVYNRYTFGNFLKGGYNYWHEASLLDFFSTQWFLFFDFSLLYNALTDLSFSHLRQFSNSSNLTYYFFGLLGFHNFSVLYSPIAFIFIVLGGNELLRSHYSRRGQLIVRFTVVALVCLLALFIPYCYQSSRFLIPILPLMAVIGAVGTVSTIKYCYLSSKSKVMSVVALLLAILFFSDLSYTYATTGIQYRQIDFAKQTGRSRMARYACAKMYNSVADARSIIASAIDINFISHFVLSGMKRTYLPLVRNIMYISKHPEIPPYNWHSLELPVVEEIPEIISLLLAAGVPVYTDDLEESTFKEQYQMLRSLYEWQVIGECSSFHIYRLHNKENN